MPNLILPATDYLSVELEEAHRGQAPLSDYRLAQLIGERLMKLYPFKKTGCAWAVTVDSDQGIFIVFDRTDLSGHGYLEHLSNIDTYDSIMRKAMLIGGEICERTLKREDCEGIRFTLRLDDVKEKHQPDRHIIVPPTFEGMDFAECMESVTPSILIAKE